MLEDTAMKRRTFGLLITLALGLLLAPLTTGARPRAEIPRIGFLAASERRAGSEALRHALRELGYVEGHHIAFEWRFAETPEQYPTLAAELVGLKVDLIVAWGAVMTLAAKQATRTIPIVMADSADAVGMGLVASLPRPGGNVTGVTSMSPDLSSKSLELLKEAIPGIARVAVFRCAVRAEPPQWLAQRDAANQREWRELHITAQRLGLHLQSLEVGGA
jgi:putative tryptophan/tyrosine transport system substrate-binding protein